jgi:3-phenylpropionate/cinnamic acid dioxygenase small subunit
VIRAQAHYAVFRTKPGDASEVYNVGRYIDELVRDASGALRCSAAGAACTTARWSSTR